MEEEYLKEEEEKVKEEKQKMCNRKRRNIERETEKKVSVNGKNNVMQWKKKETIRRKKGRIEVRKDWMKIKWWTGKNEWKNLRN